LRVERKLGEPDVRRTGRVHADLGGEPVAACQQLLLVIEAHHERLEAAALDDGDIVLLDLVEQWAEPGSGLADRALLHSSSR